jgi:hypothetical protein
LTTQNTHANKQTWNNPQTKEQQMYQLNAPEIEILIDALNLALASNKRMQTAKPKFAEIFNKIETDITAIKIKLLTSPNKQK